MKTEIIYDMPEDQYHSETGLDEGKYVTRSMIAAYAQDPASFHLRYVEKHPLMQFAGNKGTDLGSFVEAYLLDRDTSNYVVIPELCENQKGEIVKWNLRSGQTVIGEVCTTKEWVENNPKTHTVADTEYAKFIGRRFGETNLGQYWVNKISESKKQVTVRWTDEISGLNCQIRIDNYLPDVFLCDLKTTAKDYTRFSQTADDYGYHMQASLYSDAMELATGKRLPFLFAICETTGLKRARIVQLHPTQIEFAKKEYMRSLVGIANEDWNTIGYDATQAEVCDLPAFMLYKYENEV